MHFMHAYGPRIQAELEVGRLTLDFVQLQADIPVSDFGSVLKDEPTTVLSCLAIAAHNVRTLICFCVFVFIRVCMPSCSYSYLNPSSKYKSRVQPMHALSPLSLSLSISPLLCCVLCSVIDVVPSIVWMIVNEVARAIDHRPTPLSCLFNHYRPFYRLESHFIRRK